MGARATSCRKCGATNIPDATFCEICGAKLEPAPVPSRQPPAAAVVQVVERAPQDSQQIAAGTSMPLYSVQVRSTDDAIRAMGEGNKLALFGLVGKRTLIGKKPEEYVVLESMTWGDRVYVRVHGVYTATYTVDVTYPLTVGEETVEVEVAGPNRLAPVKGTLELPARLRKFLRIERTSTYDDRAEEVQVQLPPKSDLKMLRTARPPLTNDGAQKLLDTTLEWARRIMRASATKAMARGAKVEKEELDLSDHEVILVPYCVLTYLNSKSGERKSLTFDSLGGVLLPAAFVRT